MNHRFLSDASFHPPTKMAIIGYRYQNQIVSKVISDTKNIDAEIHAFQMAVQSALDKGYELRDCQFVTDCEKVMRIGSAQCLHMIKIKGHKPRAEKDQLDREFAELDRTLRRSLRKKIGV